MSASIIGKNGPAIPPSNPRSYEVKVQRQPLPPRRWHWLIVEEATQVVVQQSRETFPSAQEAWAGGRKRLGKPA
ncbi:hypothetical protein [Paracraurococcus ruber]|uniref:Uncharacterized protein n=1 Tax=Paracraurococcus ruber TaxID=77675 RepID=A0ABS1CXU3_9PROT|nr:hypothetical protein [Paracraurococcus ruber]MBK1659131.1 hypothetical protein [Paracraurococcus ruber]TDG31923.1 hypothetical protein E2C05_09210 [Paracraurococcus ruber]